MAQNRRDCLKECNDRQVPLEDFQLAFCNRCMQSECTRSLHGKTRFDQRVLNWEERLFLHPPKMDPGDKRYAGIASQQFTTVQVPLGWDSSMSPPLVPVQTAEVDLTPQAQSPEAAPKIQAPVQQPPPPPDIPDSKGQPVSDRLLGANTRVPATQMLPGGKMPPKPPMFDPWAPKEPVVPVGGQVVLGKKKGP